MVWCSLKSKLIELRNQFVPLEKTSKEHSWKENGSIPIDKATRESIRQKNIKRRSWMVARNRNDVDHACNIQKHEIKSRGYYVKLRYHSSGKSRNSQKQIQKHSGPILDEN